MLKSMLTGQKQMTKAKLTARKQALRCMALTRCGRWGYDSIADAIWHVQLTSSPPSAFGCRASAVRTRIPTALNKSKLLCSRFSGFLLHRVA